MSTIKAQKIQPPGDSDSLQIFTNTVERMRVTSGGLVGIGTASPTVALDVVGGIKASTTLNVQTLLTIAESELYTTQRTFTQNINTTGSNTNNSPTNQRITGQTWLLGTFSQTNDSPSMFKFVHSSHSGNNLQSDSYEWSRTYIVDAPALFTDSTIWSNWVELPVTNSVLYFVNRNIRFDVRAQYHGPMQLRMRVGAPADQNTANHSYDGPHRFTFTTTGMATYTPETVFNTATGPVTPPLGFHGRQSYEFPVSKGNHGFAGSTAGVFILNSGNVGIGITAPTVALDVLGAGKFSDFTTGNVSPRSVLNRDATSVVGRIVGVFINGSSPTTYYSTTPLDAGVWEIHMMTNENDGAGDEDCNLVYHTIATVPSGKYLTWRLSGVRASSAAVTGLQYRLQTGSSSVLQNDSTQGAWINIPMNNTLSVATNLTTDAISGDGIKNGLVGLVPPASGTNGNLINFMHGYAKRIA